VPLGGAIGGAIDAARSSGKTPLLQRRMRDWAFCEEYDKKFRSELIKRQPWTTVSVGEVIAAEDRKEFDKVVSYLETGRLGAKKKKFMDRREELKYLAGKRAELEKVRARLQAENFDLVLFSKFDQYGFADQMGKADYRMKVTGKLLDPEKPGKPLWVRTVDASDDVSRELVNLDFNNEMDRPFEEIRDEFWVMAEYIIRTFARDFD